jgi:beta-galactosidase
LKNTLLDAAGKQVSASLSDEIEMEPGQGKRLMSEIRVMQPALWSNEQPFLYTLRTELQTDKDAIDCNEIRIGIRSVDITGENGLSLNGNHVRVTGTNRHQEYPYIGYALSDNAAYRDVYKIKDAGFNLVRCSHYPPSPAFLDACDELGLLVMDIPGWQFIETHLLQPLRERVYKARDRNHPSVVMWKHAE